MLFDSGQDETLQPNDTVILDPEHVASIARFLAEQRSTGRSSKAILFDARASSYYGESRWPGTRWLVERYQDLGSVQCGLRLPCSLSLSFFFKPFTCYAITPHFYFRLNFTDIYAWEFTPRPGYKFFEGMFTDLVAATHFYNFGASAHDDPLNPLYILKATAQPGDFVLFKLDIDTPAVETPLVEQLLGDTYALSLITDFFL